MYLPRSFRVQDKKVIAAFIRRYSFCTLVTPAGGDTHISHLPLLLDDGGEPWRLRGHLARANPHCKQLNNNPAVCIFHGPHSYISPAWYADSAEVPTWNYAVVHASGPVAVIEDRHWLSKLVDESIDVYETRLPTPWDRRLPERYRRRQLEHIIGLEVTIESMQAKFKLGQNRSLDDQHSMLQALRQADADASSLAAFIDSLAPAG